VQAKVVVQTMSFFNEFITFLLLKLIPQQHDTIHQTQKIKVQTTKKYKKHQTA
jgi:hypothetical protein